MTLLRSQGFCTDVSCSVVNRVFFLSSSSSNQHVFLRIWELDLWNYRSLEVSINGSTIAPNVAVSPLSLLVYGFTAVSPLLGQLIANWKNKLKDFSVRIRIISVPFCLTRLLT